MAGSHAGVSIGEDGPSQMALEDQLGEKLFLRSGRNLVLTDMGRVVYRYADDIFSIGRELMDTLKDRPTGRPMNR